jgi:hypothetical protein
LQVDTRNDVLRSIGCDPKHHGSLSTTLKYVHLAPSALREAIGYRGSARASRLTERVSSLSSARRLCVDRRSCAPFRRRIQGERVDECDHVDLATPLHDSQFSSPTANAAPRDHTGQLAENLAISALGHRLHPFASSETTAYAACCSRRTLSSSTRSAGAAASVHTCS